MTTRPLLDRVADYYAGRLSEHGATARGVDWKSEESQNLRFEQFLPLFSGATTGSVIDYGCGYGALADFLASRGLELDYIGFDVCEPMIEAAAAAHRDRPRVRFTSDRGALEPADWCVASGIFNVRMTTPEDEWRAYILKTIDDMHALATRGFAFNVLTSYSDPEKRRNDLHYADPLELFDHCKRNVSRRVALLHDYELWEFTLLVRS